MKGKKIYFIISSIIQILICIFILCTLKAFVQSQIDALMHYNLGASQERTLSLFQNHGEIFCGSITAIVLILNLIILKIAFSNKIARNKGALITISCINLFTTLHIVVIIFSIISLIISLCIERKNPEDFPEKKEMPVVDFIKPSKKEIILSVILVILYSSQFFMSHLIENINSRWIILAYLIIFHIGIFIFSIITFKNILKRDIKLFKNNFKAYMKFFFIRYGIYFPIYLFISVLCFAITKNGTSENQTSIEALPLLLSAPLAIIWAPIVEESVYRGCLRRFIKNDILFIAISAIIFGLVHSFQEDSILKIIVIGIPYMCMGGFFAYLYKKSNNICVNIFAHFFINSIAVILSIFV